LSVSVYVCRRQYVQTLYADMTLLNVRFSCTQQLESDFTAWLLISSSGSEIDSAASR
jgi:hypothetical protein